MSNTQRPYTGFDKIGSSTHPAAKKLAECLQKRYGMKYLGGLVIRPMRSAPAKIQTLPVTDPRVEPYLSIHATGRAIDVALDDPTKLSEIFLFLLDNTDELFIEELHEYSYKAPGARKAWGRGYRCNRAKKNKGVVNWDAKNNGGTPGGLWLHAEVSPHADPEKLQAHFRKTRSK